MNLLIYILLFAAGVSSCFFYYKGRLKSWVRLVNIKIDNLISGKTLDSFSNKETERLPSEFTSIIEKANKIIQDKSQTLNKQELKTENEDLSANYKKTIDNLYIVNELGRRVTSSLNLHQTFEHLYKTINSMMDAAVLELSVANEVTGERKIFSNIKSPENNSTPYTNHIADWCFTNNREVYLEDAENDYGRYVFQPLIFPDGRVAKSVIAFPVINRNAVSGTLCISSFQKNTFSDYHREIIRLLLGYISVAIENAIRHEELNLTKIRAEQSEKFKEQFLANMSHEIRTPINAVTGMTGLLLDKQPRPDQLRYLESIRNASDSLLVIINDILDLSKIEAGKIEFEKIDFSITDLVKNVREIMQFKIEEKGLSYFEKIDENIPPILVGDPTRLIQVLINLIGNAIKFTEKGNVTLNVSLENKILPSIKLNDIVKNSFLRFDITDTGIGMTKSQVNKLFQNYAQASIETARKYGGTGLGLSISKKLVELQNGTIEVRSEAGKGSTFTFTLPFIVSNNKKVTVKEKIVSTEMLMYLRGKRILLCDDNEYNRIVVRETLNLKIEGCQIDEATNGKEALEMIRKNKYDVVLMDLVMPQLDGLEATRIIRNEFPYPLNTIPIIALTASVVKSELEKSYAAGMNGFIPKPFKSQELIGAIYNSLNNSNIYIEEPPEVRKSQPHKGVIDLSYLLEFTEGDEVRMQRQLELFIQKTPLNINTLLSALEKKDYQQIRITVHSMKPQLHFTGVISGLDIAEQIEQACIDNVSFEVINELTNKLKIICEQATVEILNLSLISNK